MSARGETVRFGAAFAAYAGLLVVSLLLLEGDRLADSAWRFPIALLPVPAGAYLVYLVAHRYRGLDEYWQRIHLTALPVAVLGSLLVAFTLGFLENAGIGRPSGFVYFGIIVGLYLLGLFLAKQRYS